MARTQLFSLIFLVALLLPNALGAPKINANSRIAGGGEARQNVLKHLVAIGCRDCDDINAFCSGTVIGTKWVISSAHCFLTNDGSGDRFGAGDVALYIESESNIDGTDKSPVYVNAIYISKGYVTSGQKTWNDIAILELDRSVPARHVVTLGSPPTDDGELVTVAGYGAVNADEDDSTLAKQAKVRHLNYDTCLANDEDVIGDVNEKYSSCAISIEKEDWEDADERRNTTSRMAAPRRTGLCGGDSGGPVFKRDEGRLIQYGINSHYVKCGDSELPMWFERLDGYFDDIESIKTTGSASTFRTL